MGRLRLKIKFRENSNGCHECTSHALNSWGYPIIHDLKYKTYLLHRYLWIEKYGKIPEGICVLHHCDNPKCINLKHLFLGTNYDNVQDKILKNRQAKGIFHGRVKLCEVDAIKIFLSKETESSLARKFHISRGHVCHIRQGKIWKHVTGGLK